MVLKEKSFEKSKELFEAALKEFGDNGYENASLNNILKIAGISKGTFYYHFKNKEDIYVYLIGILIEEKKKFFVSKITQELLSKNFFEVLEAIIEIGLQFAQQNPSINKFSEQFIKKRNNPVFKRALQRLNIENESSNFLDSFIETAYTRNEIRDDISKTFMKSIVNYLFIHITDFADISKTEDIKETIKYLIKFLKTGMSKS